MTCVGVLALQGDFLEHVQLLKELPNVEVVAVKSRADLGKVDALVIPGGESTTIGELMKVKGLDKEIIDFARSGRPVVGVCAGAILLAKKVADRVVGETGQPTLGLMDIGVLRNAFGRQRESFEAEVEVEGVGRVRAIFIRGPAIVEAWGDARIVGYVEHPTVGKVGAVAAQGNMLAVAFHPEISGDTRIYEFAILRAKR